MRRGMVAANWKMNGSKSSVEALVSAIKADVGEIADDQCVLFPPYIFIDQVQAMLTGSKLSSGAQNLSVHDAGAYTGEVSAGMLRDFACRYVLVGHSERRQLFNEDNATVAAKFAQAQKHGLIPVLCVGESLADREAGNTEQVVQAQLDAVLALPGAISVLQQAVIAYEPIWAIGTGLTASPDQAQAVHHFLRNYLAKSDEALASQVHILYGGSVKSSNAADLFSQPDIDGGLIGGASLDATEFLEIVKCIK